MWRRSSAPRSTGREVVACIANFSPVPRLAYRIGLPRGGAWREILNTDSAEFAGSDVGNAGSVWAGDQPWHGLDHSAALNLPPLAVIWLKAPDPDRPL